MSKDSRLSLLMGETALKVYNPLADEWYYSYGVMLKALEKLWHITKDDKYFKYIKKYADSVIDSKGNIKEFLIEDYNIDNINNGKILFPLLERTKAAKYKKALSMLWTQMKTHPRLKNGAFWHKRIYPYQFWLDGLYMGSPFLAEYAIRYKESSEVFNDIVNQFLIAEKHLKDEKTGLYYHAWDASRGMKWSDDVTGRSPHIWSRAIGWMVMAIVDLLEILPENFKKRKDLERILKEALIPVIKHQDKKTGCWYQITDLPKRKGNYIESSATCMFVYAIKRSAALKYIPSEYSSAAETGWLGIKRHFLKYDPDGTIHITSCCKGAGLGNNPYRDGSFEYYINEKVIDDDPKSIGAFIMTALEMGE